MKNEKDSMLHLKADKTPVHIGLKSEEREQLAGGLAKLLADTYTLYLKTHNFHWNVKGPHFSNLHIMFEGQYEELAGAVDVIAERIRALGFRAPGSYAEFSKMTSIIEETSNSVPHAKDMIKQLLEGHETIVRTAREILTTADSVKDYPTQDLLTTRQDIHEKTAWMLRAQLEE